MAPTTLIRGRWLSPDEKAYEVGSFLQYREDPSKFRTAHPEAKGGEGWIDPEVLPLVDALNGMEGVCTVQSCCGHRGTAEGADGAPYEWVHPGQLWLRLSEPVALAFDVNVGVLLAAESVEHVQKLYAYRSMGYPHEVFDVQWTDGRMDVAEREITDFFRRITP